MVVKRIGDIDNWLEWTPCSTLDDSDFRSGANAGFEEFGVVGLLVGGSELGRSGGSAEAFGNGKFGELAGTF